MLVQVACSWLHWTLSPLCRPSIDCRVLQASSRLSGGPVIGFRPQGRQY
jgi:hypothetical protein